MPTPFSGGCACGALRHVVFSRACDLLAVSLSGLPTCQWERVLRGTLCPKSGAERHGREQILRCERREWEYREPRILSPMRLSCFGEG